jgi:prepilin-type N-terminal cleavage/methylation domain-containing protein/uncharacterized repeat protein (TIGR02543 family)
MMQKSRDKNRASKGFTLAELLAVVAILSILLGMTFVGVVTYRKNLRLMEMNETAKEIYIAAQNQLTYANVNGTLNDLSKEELVQEGGVYCLYNTKNNTNSDTWKQVLLPFGSVDETVRNGSWIIEMNADTWSIEGVFYSGSEDNIAHSSEVLDLAAGMENQADVLLSRLHDIVKSGNKSEQKNFYYGNQAGTIFGYYGGDQASDVNPVDPTDKNASWKAPVLSVTNGSALWLNISIPMKYDDLSTSGARLLLKVTGTESQKTVSLTLRPRDISASKAYDLDVQYSDGSSTSKGCSFRIERDNLTAQAAYHILLDDVTDKYGNNHFAHLFEELTPGENIKISATMTSTSMLAGALYSNTVQTNSLFADAQAGSVQIANFRHLENLDSNISGFQKAPAHNSSSAPVQAEQTADLDWTAFIADRAFSDKFTTAPESAGGIGSSFTITGADGNGMGSSTYVPVTPNAALTYLGADHKISNVACSTANNAGLFGAVSNDLAVQDLYLNNVTVHTDGTGSCAGSLIGSVTGGSTKVNNVLVSSDYDKLRANKAADQKNGKWLSQVTSNGISGGLIGSVEGGSVDITNTASTAVVQGATYAGGLVGQVAQNAAASFTNSYVGGHTIVKKGNLVYDYDKENPTRANISVTGNDGYAGGFIGHSDSDVNVNACYSTASVASAAAKHADCFANMGNHKIVTSPDKQSYYGSGDVNGNPWEDFYLVGAPIAEEDAVAEHPFFREGGVTHSTHVVSVKALGGDISSAPWFIQQHVGDWTDLVDKEEIYTVTFHDHAYREGEKGEANLFKGRDSDRSRQQVKAGEAVPVIPELQTKDTRAIAGWYWNTGEEAKAGTPIYGIYLSEENISADKREYFVLGNPEGKNFSALTKYTGFDPKKENKLTQVLSDLDVYPIYNSEDQYAIFESVHETQDSAGNAVRQQNLIARKKIDENDSVEVPAFQTVPGYQFTNWSSTENGNTKLDGMQWGKTLAKAREKLGTGLTAYAQYERIQTYQVRIQFRYIPSDETFSSINDGSAVYWDLVYTREATDPFRETISLPDELKENYYNKDTTKIYRLGSDGKLGTDESGNPKAVEGIFDEDGSLDFSMQGIQSDADYVVVFKGANTLLNYTIQYQLRSSAGPARIVTEEDGSKTIDTTKLTYQTYQAASETGAADKGVVSVTESGLTADKDSVVAIEPLTIPGFHVVGSYPQYYTLNSNNQVFTITYDRDSAWLFYDLSGGTYTVQDETETKTMANIAPTPIVSGQTIDANPQTNAIAEPINAVRNGCWLPRTATTTEKEETKTEWYDVDDSEISDEYKYYKVTSSIGYTTYYRYVHGSWQRGNYYYSWDGKRHWYWNDVTDIPDKAKNPTKSIRCSFDYEQWQWKWQVYGSHTVQVSDEEYTYNQPIWRFYTEVDYQRAREALEDAKRTAKEQGQEVKDSDYNILTYLDMLENESSITRIKLSNGTFTAGAGNYYAILDWQKPEKASVKVELFVQQVSDDPDIKNDSDKNYYYFSTVDGPECSVEKETNFQDFQTNYSADAIAEKYKDNSNYSIFNHLTLSQTHYDMKKVQPDGNTVVRLYYNRNIITINFNYRGYYLYYGGKTETYQGLYQSPFTNSTIWENNEWLHDDTNTVLTFLTKFEYNDYETIDLYEQEHSSGTATINHYLEDPKNTNINNRGIYLSEPSQTTTTVATNFILSNKYLGYSLYQYEVCDNNTGGVISSDPASDQQRLPVGNGQTLKIYYRRNTQKIILNNAVVDADKASATNPAQPVVSSENETPYQQVLYQDTVSKLPGKDAVTRPAGVSSEAVFDGWAESSASDAELVTDNEGKLNSPFTMQYYDRQFFAKWVMPDTTVTLHNVNGPGQDTTKEVSVEKYSMYTPPAVTDPDVLAAPDGYAFDGWYTDSSYTVPYVDTQITGETDLYARWKETAGSWTYTIQGIDADTGELIQDFPNATVVVSFNGTKVAAPTSTEYPNNDVLQGYYPVAASRTVTPTADEIADETKRVIRFAYRKTDRWSYSVAYHIAGADNNGISSVIRVPQDNAEQKYLAVTASEETTVFTPSVDFLRVNNSSSATLLYITGMQETQSNGMKGEVQNVGYLMLDRKDDSNCQIDVFCTLDFSGFVKDVAKTYDGSADSVDKDLQELCKGSDLTVETAYQDKNSKTLSSAPVDAGEYTAVVTVKRNGQPVWTSAKLKYNIYRRTVILQSGPSGQAWTVKTDGEGSEGFADGEGASYAFESGSVFTYTLNQNTKKENYNIIRKFASQSS